MRILATLLSLPLPFLTAQTAVTLTCDRDNTLYESATGALSNGRGAWVFVGRDGQNVRKRTLLHFDLTPIPAGARILGATLALNVSRTAAFADLGIDVHRVLADWGEGTSNAAGEEGRGTAATTNDATWLHRRYPSQFWVAPGGDFQALPSASGSTPPTGSAVFGGAGMVADVQSWLDAPAGNHGWLLKSNEAIAYATRRFESRENTVATWRPALQVTYVAPGGTALVGSGCPGSAALPFALTLGGAPVGGGTLQLQHQNGQPGALAANLLSLVWDGMPIPVWVGCDLLLPPAFLVTHNVLQLDGAGTSSTNLPVPYGFAGLLVAMQAVALDSGAGAGFVLSNAAIAVLQ